jgi:hypothetical protein
MKKVFLILCLAYVSVQANAQQSTPLTPVSVPVDSITHKITYESVIEVKGVSADELHKRIVSWFNEYYKNPTEVIRENDSINHKVVGKPRFRLSNPPSKDVKKDGGVTQYTITVGAKDGRFRYEITDVNWKQTSLFPAEKWMDTKSPSYEAVYNEYLNQLNQTTSEVIASLKKAVTEAKPVKNKDAW